MRAWRIGLYCLCLGWVALFGCRSSGPDWKRPKEPERISIPPESDPRYNQPPKYPKDTLEMDPYRKTSGPGTGMPLNGRRPGIGGASGF